MLSPFLDTYMDIAATNNILPTNALVSYDAATMKGCRLECKHIRSIKFHNTQSKYVWFEAAQSKYVWFEAAHLTTNIVYDALAYVLN